MEKDKDLYFPTWHFLRFLREMNYEQLRNMLTEVPNGQMGIHIRKLYMHKLQKYQNTLKVLFIYYLY